MSRLSPVEAYARLHLPYGSSAEDARRSFRELFRKNHPDRFPEGQAREAAEERVKGFVEALDVIELHLTTEAAAEQQRAEEEDELARKRANRARTAGPNPFGGQRRPTGTSSADGGATAPSPGPPPQPGPQPPPTPRPPYRTRPPTPPRPPAAPPAQPLPTSRVYNRDVGEVVMLAIAIAVVWPLLAFILGATGAVDEDALGGNPLILLPMAWPLAEVIHWMRQVVPWQALRRRVTPGSVLGLLLVITVLGALFFGSSGASREERARPPQRLTKKEARAELPTGMSLNCVPINMDDYAVEDRERCEELDVLHGPAINHTRPAEDSSPDRLGTSFLYLRLKNLSASRLEELRQNGFKFRLTDNHGRRAALTTLENEDRALGRRRFVDMTSSTQDGPSITSPGTRLIPLSYPTKPGPWRIRVTVSYRGKPIFSDAYSTTVVCPSGEEVYPTEVRVPRGCEDDFIRQCERERDEYDGGEACALRDNRFQCGDADDYGYLNIPRRKVPSGCADAFVRYCERHGLAPYGKTCALRKDGSLNLE